jgi:hypothetical protein
VEAAQEMERNNKKICKQTSITKKTFLYSLHVVRDELILIDTIRKPYRLNITYNTFVRYIDREDCGTITTANREENKVDYAGNDIRYTYSKQ